MFNRSASTADAPSATPKSISLSFRAAMFVFLVCFALFGICVWQIWQARSDQLQKTTAAATNLSKALAQHAYDTFKEADTVLVGLVDQLQAEDMANNNVERLHKFLLNRVIELPQLHGLFIYDATGRWLVNSQQAIPSATLNNSDREYFIYHRDHVDPGPHIGPAIKSKSTGEWIVTISRRINHPDGSFAGVALATIKMDYFRKFYDSLDIGTHGAILVATDKGVILIRRPFNEKLLGRDISTLPLFHDYLPRSLSGTQTMVSGLDGVTRINSYRRLEQYPLVIAAALSKEEALAEWRSAACLQMAAVILLVGGFALLGMRLIRQISQNTKAEAELEILNDVLQKLAMQDGLTGLANRRQFDISLKSEFLRAKRNKSSLALIMLDVDYFKQYNDIYGHAAGDECLKVISNVIAIRKKRPADLNARYGGEEMAVLLPETELDGAVQIAETIRREINELQLVHSGNPIGKVTVSAGVSAFVPIEDTQIIDLIETADRALYLAKSQGRNQVCSQNSLRRPAIDMDDSGSYRKRLA